MASVNFGTHRLELLASYQDVIQEETPTDWALYTYDGDTDNLTLSSSGGGGLPDLSSHFENQKVMYGFCSVKDPLATLPRYVLVNWVGEDVPDARKCACASHVAKIADFFQGVDIIVNASSVEDIEPGAIGQRLSNGTARLSSPVLNRLRVREEDGTEPVGRTSGGVAGGSPGLEGTTYQKTNAAVEMKHINREQFWEQAKKEEEMRKEEEKQKALEDRLRFEQERMELEKKEQEEREKRYQEREQQIEEHRRKQMTLEEEEAKQRLKEQSIFAATETETEEAQLKRTESEVEEAAAIIAQRTENPLEFFKQQERVASTSSETSLPLIHHRPGSQSDVVHRTPGSSATSPPDSSTSSSTPICEDGERPPDTPYPIPKGSLAARFDSEAGPDGMLASSIQEVQEPWSPFERLPQDTSVADVSPSAHLPHPQVSWSSGGGLVQVEDLVFTETKEMEAFPAAPLPEEAESIMDFVDVPPALEGARAVDNSQSLLDIWQSDDAGAWVEPCQAEKKTNPRMKESQSPAGTAELDNLAGSMDDNLLNFDELPEPPATFCDLEPEDDPQSIIDIEGPHQMTLSYQHALQEASSSHEIPVVLVELEEAHLMTNGETTQKEGATVSEGYFSQSQEDEFAQSEELTAKAPPVFYNKPPEIDITCWDADHVMEEDDNEEGFGGND